MENKWNHNNKYENSYLTIISQIVIKYINTKATNAYNNQVLAMSWEKSIFLITNDRLFLYAIKIYQNVFNCSCFETLSTQ